MIYIVYLFIAILCLSLFYVVFNIIKSNKGTKVSFNLGSNAKASTSVSTESLFIKKHKKRDIVVDTEPQTQQEISKFQWVVSDGYKNSNSNTEGTTDMETKEDNITTSNKKKLWNILLVDDAYSIRKKFERMMAGSEINIVLKENGEEAIKYLNDNTPHLIITDIEMPKVDGIELLKYLKSNSKLSHIPVIIISSNIDKYMSLLESHNAQSLLNKPFTDEEVFSQIWFLLK